LIGYLLNAAISPEAMSNWGWRVPFFIGCMIVPFLFYIRRSLEETEEFQRRKHHPTMNEVFASLARNWWIVILGMLLVGMTTIVPATVRTAGFSLAYSLATALLGGFTPLVSTWLIELTGNGAAPAFWLALGGACGLVATLLIYQTRVAPAAPAAPGSPA